jgi:hypothetical protein
VKWVMLVTSPTQPLHLFTTNFVYRGQTCIT